ncbi:MAG: hypothetical protein MPK62_07060 [Alphaproteobacteria bacterium]|jgi:hypothetical protein|nr:hypothetical protein [Alphaproteobacteria bacterium]|tara:strand:- start:1343 stop:1489 length:147 start_codon:yes stop_codon:yes gene_type:complete
MNHNEKKERTVKGTKYILENGRWIKAPSTELDPHDPDYSWDWDLENRR